MSTNISEIMFQLERYGVPPDEVAKIVTQLLIAGQRTVYAAKTEEARRRLEGAAASVVFVKR